MSNLAKLEQGIQVLTVHNSAFCLIYGEQNITLPDESIQVIVRKMAEHLKRKKEEELNHV